MEPPKIKLIDAPIGLFEYDGTIALKTEYSTAIKSADGSVTVVPDCYTVDGGEVFWGGVSTAQEKNNLYVPPIFISHFDATTLSCQFKYSGNNEEFEEIRSPDVT